MIYVGLFEKSGRMARPFADAGWRCVCVDIDVEPGFRDGIDFVQSDIRELPINFLGSHSPDFVAAFPPCDHLAVSGARWFKGKGLRKLAQSVELFAEAAEHCERSDAPYFIENPVSTISTYWRKPDYTFNPSDYAGCCPDDTYSKKTCLWTGGGFVMPQPCPIEGAEIDSRIHLAPPGPGRKDFRSATPLGFARAVFAANFSGQRSAA